MDEIKKEVMNDGGEDFDYEKRRFLTYEFSRKSKYCYNPQTLVQGKLPTGRH